MEILKKLLPGLLPLLIFIAADEIWGTEIGLLVAVVFGLGQLIVIYIKDKRIDKFVLYDTLLLVAMGVVSIILDNDIFFKLKPALIGVIFCIVLGISSFTRHNFMMNMSKRYMKDVQMNEAQIKYMNRSTRIMFFIFTAHTLLVFYSAFYMSKEAWAFISSGLLYIIFAIYFVLEFVKNKYFRRGKMLANNEEWLPVVDESGKLKGKATRAACHQNKELLHPVVHLHVINRKKEIYLQKRPDDKLIQPGKWDTAVGGHIAFNETIEAGLKRETAEELNIKEFQPQLIQNYIWETDVERELVFMFISVYEKAINYNPEEIADGKFWKVSEIKKQIGKEIFTPNFEKEFQILSKML